MTPARLLAAAAAFALSTLAAQAATVATGGTQVTGTTSGTTAYFMGSTPLVAVADPSNAWALGPMAPGYADAVWVNSDVNERLSEFTFTFSLKGFEVGSAALSVMLALDDYITVALNGNTIFEDNDQSQPGGANWSVLQEFTNSAFFKAGTNVLTFSIVNTGGPGGLRASTIVTATPSAVPLPAGLPLLAGALAAFGLIARRRKRA